MHTDSGPLGVNLWSSAARRELGIYVRQWCDEGASRVRVYVELVYPPSYPKNPKKYIIYFTFIL